MRTAPRDRCRADRPIDLDRGLGSPRPVLALLLVLLAGCEDVARSLGRCEDEQSAYASNVAGQGELVDAPPAAGPFPMALVVSQKAASDLLAAVTGGTLPALTADGGLVQVALTPRFPTIRIEELVGCAGCLTADLSFDLDVTVAGLGTLRGGGSARLGAPLELHPGGLRRTLLVAGMERARVLDIEVNAQGLSTSQIPLVRDLARGLAEKLIREEIGSTELTAIDSWTLGAGEMELAPRGPTLLPAQGSIVIGLATNLDLPATSTLEEQGTLPEGTDISLRFHPGLLLGVSQRLMTEGEIPSRYDGEGAASTTGAHHVSIEDMAAGDEGALRTLFRVYRLGGGLCGSVDLSGDLALQVSDGAISLQARSLEVVGGTGAGRVLSEAAWLGGDFLSTLIGNLELTLNYRELSVGDAPADLSPTSFSIDGSGVTINLDLVD